MRDNSESTNTSERRTHKHKRKEGKLWKTAAFVEEKNRSKKCKNYGYKIMI